MAALLLVVAIIIPMLVSPQEQQQSSVAIDTSFLTTNSQSTIIAIEKHLFSPNVRNNFDKLFNSRKEYQGEITLYPSYKYTFEGFWRNWKTLLTDGSLFAGDDSDHYVELCEQKPCSSFDPARPSHAEQLRNNRTMTIRGFEYGLANIATFISQIMIDGIYDDVCLPNVTCETPYDEDQLWKAAMSNWATNVQQYSSSADFGGNDGDGWNYQEKLVEFVNGGMNLFEYYPEIQKVDTDVDYAFIHAVSSIVSLGCADALNCEKKEPVVDIKLPQRRSAFTIALSALHIPTMRSELVVEQTLQHLKSAKEGFEMNLLLFNRNGEIFPSQRYTFDNMYDSIQRMSRPINATNSALYPTNSTTAYFYSVDHAPLYMGDPFMRYGQKYGLANIALFFANGLDRSIETDDSCDEVNVDEVNGRIALSNSCGQRGLSYQDMNCPLACQFDPNIYITAVTHKREVGAAPPMQCGPKSQIPWTGFWDSKEMYESDTSYSNVNGRVDVEGCCFWARGVLQTKGACMFGRLNYYLGSRAASEGRESLYPNIDFCLQPEVICGSQYRHELIWITGLFEWIDRIQTYDMGGFHYMTELHYFADNGNTDTDFIKKVGAIVQSGCHSPPCENAGCLNFPCDGASPVDEEAIIAKAYRTFSELNLGDIFPTSEGGSNSPTPVPTQCETNCTDEPTLSPLTPTSIPSDIPSTPPTIFTDMINLRHDYMKTYLEYRRPFLESTVFVTETQSGLEPTKYYTLDGFLSSLEDFVTEGVNGLMFIIGQGANSFEQGLVNIALFLAHAKTRGLLWDTCEEVNHQLVDGKLPLSNACGQFGQMYSDQNCPAAMDASQACAIDMSASLVATTAAGNSSSPPFFCAPTSTQPYTGFYEPISDKIVTKDPFNNAIGRKDVEGCCFWGRGILLTAGVCHIGRFNHLYKSRYNIDFCSSPDSICSDSTTTIDTSQARYDFGLVHWIDYVQQFNTTNFTYTEELRLFVDGGMSDFSFVDKFSEFVMNSSHDATARRANFENILGVLLLDITESPSTSHSPSTHRPSISPSEMTSKPSIVQSLDLLKPTDAPQSLFTSEPSRPPREVKLDFNDIPVIISSEALIICDGCVWEIWILLLIFMPPFI